MRPVAHGVMLGVLSSLLAAGSARAEPELTEPAAAPAKLDAHGRTFSQQLADQLTVLGAELDRHLELLSRSTLGLRIDGRRRRAHLHLVAGDARSFGVTLAGDVQFRAGAARVAARLDLTLAGRQLSFDVPTLDLVPRSWNGERYLEVQLPVLRGSF